MCIKKYFRGTKCRTLVGLLKTKEKVGEEKSGGAIACGTPLFAHLRFAKDLFLFACFFNFLSNFPKPKFRRVLDLARQSRATCIYQAHA